MSFAMQPRACPCGSTSYDACCGALHRGERQAASPEELMRARFSAYALGESDYVWRTWHPRTRPDKVNLDPEIRWTQLEIIESTGRGSWCPRSGRSIGS